MVRKDSSQEILIEREYQDLSLSLSLSLFFSSLSPSCPFSLSFPIIYSLCSLWTSNYIVPQIWIILAPTVAMLILPRQQSRYALSCEAPIPSSIITTDTCTVTKKYFDGGQIITFLKRKKNSLALNVQKCKSWSKVLIFMLTANVRNEMTFSFHYYIINSYWER